MVRRLWNLMRSWFGQGLENLDDPNYLIRQAKEERCVLYRSKKTPESIEKAEADVAAKIRQAHRLRGEYEAQRWKGFAPDTAYHSRGRRTAMVLFALCLLCWLVAMLRHS